MGTECMTAIIALTIGFLGLTAMLRNYKARFDKKSITLEKNDQQNELRQQLNEQRIKHLEAKINELENKYERRK